MKKYNNGGYATNHKRSSNYGSRGWRSEDGLFNEFNLRSDAVAYVGTDGGKEEFLSFYRQIAPSEVLERVWKFVHG